MENYIVKQNSKGNEFYIFCLNSEANKGNINSIELSSGNYTSWSEASYGFYLSLKKVHDKEILECIKRDFKKMYDVEIGFKSRITKNDRKILWGTKCVHAAQFGSRLKKVLRAFTAKMTAIYRTMALFY